MGFTIPAGSTPHSVSHRISPGIDYVLHAPVHPVSNYDRADGCLYPPSGRERIGHSYRNCPRNPVVVHGGLYCHDRYRDLPLHGAQFLSIARGHLNFRVKPFQFYSCI